MPGKTPVIGGVAKPRRMIAEEMPALADRLHVEANENDRIAACQDRDIKRLKTGIRTVVNDVRIQRKADFIATSDEIEPVTLSSIDLVIVLL